MPNPVQLRLAFYGDDFSGSTDAMESLALAGIRTVLFLQPPTTKVLEKYAGLQAIGLAGISRSMTRDEMHAELSRAFAALRQLSPPLVHYKVCSTFDSSPDVGSIGKAIEVGRDVFQSPVVPLVVGAPVLGRYCVFGNLFARSGLDSPVYRLDRHPTMSRHPVTPMDESDLRLILSRQTDCRVDLVDHSHLQDGYESSREQSERLIAEGAKVILFDTVSNEQLPLVGRLVWDFAEEVSTEAAGHSRTVFAVGSSGLGYALTAYWRERGMLPPAQRAFSTGPAARVAIVSGSCSPVTDRQIAYAVEHGFAEIAVDSLAWIDPETAEGARRQTLQAALAHIESGRSVIIHTSRGPEDPRIAAVRQEMQRRNVMKSTAALLGSQLGELLRELIERADLQRVAVAGGDTGGYVAQRLGVEGLELVAPVAPGSPLCRIHGTDGHETMTGIEIAFKGGQVGRPDYLVRVRDGTGT